MKKLVSILFFSLCCTLMMAQETYKTKKDISYTVKTDSYAKERLKLDIYYPTDKKGCPVVIWFHGGGLTGGSKELPQRLHDKGMVVVGVNYRLLPKVTIDKCLDDCAEAVAWVFAHINEYGGDTSKLFVSGHSAGGYITMMLGLDKKWLSHYGIDANSIRGLIPFSGQAISHFSYRKMLGMSDLQPIIDEYAPLYWVRKDCPPLILITGDRETELLGRYEENALLMRYMKLTGNTTTKLYEIDGHDHGAMVEPSFHILLDNIKEILAR